MNAVQVGEMKFTVNAYWEENDKYPCGTLSYYVGREKRSVAFDGVTELMLQMDCICDQQGHPQRDTQLRSIPGFRLALEDREEYSPVRIGYIREQPFLISITGRLHSSFQGYMTVFNKKLYFRSELRLINLIYEMIEHIENASFPRTDDIV